MIGYCFARNFPRAARGSSRGNSASSLFSCFDMIQAPQSLEELDLLASEPDRALVETLSRIDGDVVVAGAGGKMGYHLSRMLRRGFDTLGASNRVIAVSRFGEEETRAPFEDHHITTHPADLTDAAALAALPDASTVFFLAGRKFGTGDSPETLALYNEEMPALVAERYAGASIVALSTGCVYPFVAPDSGGATEAADAPEASARPALPRTPSAARPAWPRPARRSARSA